MELQRMQEWKVNSNFSYLHFIGEKHVCEIADSSLFNGSIVENNEWENVSLKNSDFEATRIINCNMVNSSFADSNMHSLWIIDTKFINIDFSKAEIIDCTFINCTLLNCKFNSTSLNNSVFDKCQLNKIHINKASINRNTFNECLIANLQIRNVFYYSYFNACTFQNVSFEAYLLGYTYGLSSDNLLSLHFLYMGKKCSDDITTVCENIRNIYTERHMLINMGVLYLIDTSFSENLAIIKCFELLNKYIQHNYLIKKEQIEFLDYIVEIMSEKKALLPIALIKLINIVNEILMINTNTSLTKAFGNINMVRNHLFSLYYNFIDNAFSNIDTKAKPGKFIVKIIYYKKPDLQLVDLLEEIEPEAQPPTLVKTASGSFIEWISCTSNMISCIDVFFGFLGIVVPIIWDNNKSSKKKKKSENEKAPITLEINNTFQVSDLRKTEALSNMTFNAISKVMQNRINKTINIIVNNSFIESPDLKGYNQENVKSIEISRAN